MFAIIMEYVQWLILFLMFWMGMKSNEKIALIMNWDEVRAHQYRQLSDMVIKTQERRIADLEKKINDRNGEELRIGNELKVERQLRREQFESMKAQYDELAACYLTIQEDRRIMEDADALVMRSHDQRLENMEELFVALAKGINIVELRERVDVLYGCNDGVHEGEAQSVDGISSGVDRQSEIEPGRPDLQSGAAEASEEAHV